MKWIKYEPSQSELFLETLKSKLFSSESLTERKTERGDEAARAFGLLGLEAASAVPRLVRLLNDPKPSRDAERAAAAPFGLRPPWFGGPSGRSARAAAALYQLGPLGLDPLLSALTNESVVVRQRAAPYLVWAAVQMEASTAVPILAQCLQDPRPAMRCSAAQALGDFGPEARCALPALRKALRDPDPVVRLRATNTLGVVAPEELPPGIRAVE